jgi:2-polyprenyl-3-methyl-5-hydroxy-6-metoxy-1,4-benzoquinol methylase
VCGSRKNTKIYNQRFVLPTKYFFHSGYDVSICDRCGFVYADNIPDQEFFEEYYKEMSKKTFYLEKKIFKKTSSDTNYFKEMNKRIHFSLNNIEKYISKKDRILDIGCYTGELLSLLKEKGYKNLVGLDPSEYAVKLAKKWYGLNVITGSAFDDLDLGEFDFIILTHVMEHIKDLKFFLHKVSSFLAKGGKVYIESPNAANFFISQSDKYLPEHQEPFQQFSIEHINFYTKTSLSNLMKDSGFNKVSLKTQVSVIAILASVWELKSLPKDIKIEKKMKTYISESKEVLKDITTKINKLKKKNESIYVWGAGVHSQKLLALTDLISIKIDCFIDTNPAYKNGKLVGKNIISPEELKKMPLRPILISSKGYQNDILSKIKEMELRNEIIILYD